MQPPISLGTVLQYRYRVLSILGQGGFGRTYLAEDQGRFNEPCALKEFIPSQTSDYALDKSRELFQREAAILYQIQHPQVPQFRATFEEDQRLFLVQDYVEGKTYRDLLNERKLHGMAFSEAEVLQLVRQLIPVLAHIHARGIIHRDITPDNIILRQRDQLPVLIDFGVVKEIVTRIQTAETATHSTTVGKLGYAPSEQMQTGRAYPSSDFYALAVTAVVLLTGKEPQELYDDSMLTWHWQQWTQVSPGLAQVLNRMLSYRPGDRYQSASEVAQALQQLSHPGATPPPPTIQTPPQPRQTDMVSRMQTIAVGRRPEPTTQSSYAPASPRRSSGPSIPRRTEQSVWDNPWAVFGIGTSLAIITVITVWAVVMAVYRPAPEPPVVSPSPAEPEPTPSPSPSPTDRPVEYQQRLSLPPGGSTTTEGSLRANETINYLVSAEEGETLNTYVEGEGVLLSVFSPSGELVDNRAERVSFWEGTLAESGDYTIQIRPVQGLEQSDYQLSVNLAAPEPEPEPTPSPSPTPVEPEIETRRLSFPDGETGVEVSGRASAEVIRRYLVNAQAGQILSAELLEGPVTLNIRYPNGELVEDASGVVFWQAQLPETGDYQIDVIATQPSDFTLDVSVTGGE
jgi:serine/threonine-protein kinase